MVAQSAYTVILAEAATPTVVTAELTDLTPNWSRITSVNDLPAVRRHYTLDINTLERIHNNNTLVAVTLLLSSPIEIP